MVALGMAAPELSVTVPKIEPYTAWPNAAGLNAQMVIAEPTIQLHATLFDPACQSVLIQVSSERSTNVDAKRHGGVTSAAQKFVNATKSPLSYRSLTTYFTVI